MEVEEFDIYAQKGMKQLENVVDKRSILEDFINSSGQNIFFFLPKTETEFISTESFQWTISEPSYRLFKCFWLLPKLSLVPAGEVTDNFM